MKAFAELLDRLVYCPSRNGKLKLMSDYFATTPDPDRGWALAALTGSLKLSLPMRRIVRELMERHADPVLFEISRDYVGDTAETVALIWPEPESEAEPPSLDEVIGALAGADAASGLALLESWLDQLDATGRWALLKLATGALRVGVSARLAKLAAAQMGGVDVAELEEIWHAVAAPYETLFAWLDGQAEKPEIGSALIFRPLMLAHPLEQGEIEELDVSDYLAEWKWDGIRVQISGRDGEARLFSRTGDEISHSFPDIITNFDGDAVLDGELLVVRDGDVAPFNDLQQRLNRKTVTKPMLSRFPAHIRLYDMLFADGEDLRELPLEARRAKLEDWHAANQSERTDLSPLIETASLEELQQLWSSTREAGIEGLMLKRRTSPYLAGRPKGHWFKWKRAPLTLDTVLMYAQRGSGKRSSYYSDYTFGAWREGPDGALELVPVGKAYFGFTDEELAKLDRWVRNNTFDRFGPVRAVKPELVLEVAFDAVHPSPRHKSGVAMRFPRVHRIRWDKPAAEADRLETLKKLIVR